MSIIRQPSQARQEARARQETQSRQEAQARQERRSRQSTGTSADGTPALRGPTVARVMLGTRLQRLRVSAGISTTAAGNVIRASRSKISRMENGRVGIKVRDTADLLDLYGVSDEIERARLLGLARQSGAPGWWSGYDDVMSDWLQDYIGLEAAASGIRGFELQWVHGLFQTEEYAREVTLLAYASAAEEEIDRRVTLRMRRQELLDGSQPPHVWMVIDEAALRRPVGGPAVMQGQLKRLAERAEQPGVTIQVVPFARGAHAAAGGAFTMLRFGDPDVPDIVYLEQLTSALYLDKQPDVERYAEAMNKLTIAALTPAATRQFLTSMQRELLTPRLIDPASMARAYGSGHMHGPFIRLGDGTESEHSLMLGLSV